jgi:vacuolar iron transporter family protein
MSILTSYSRSRFLADLTLGFSDGLTVPFALTAGVSSLGKTETVIYAGLAEVCAGCLSMGIGGYLAAKGELTDAQDEASEAESSDDDTATEHDHHHRHRPDMRRDGETSCSAGELEKGLLAPGGDPEPRCVGDDDDDDGTDTEELPAAGRERGREMPSPMLTGLSIAVGYVLGGLLPLVPYFFVRKVGDGLLWSAVLCVLALFVFGFGKRMVSSGRRRAGWVWRCLWEGLQMAALGGLAAGAAVLCVNLLRGSM